MDRPAKILTYLGFIVTPIMSLADDYINFMGITFKKIPAGSFYMGSCRPDSLNKNLKIQPQCPSGGIEETRMRLLMKHRNELFEAKI